jgi:hypothetical protein
MPGDVLGCLGKFARWFPEVVPGAASGIAYRKCSAAAPVVLERQFRTWRDAIKVAPGQVARTPVTVSGLYRGCTESEHRARLTVACFALLPAEFVRAGFGLSRSVVPPRSAGSGAFVSVVRVLMSRGFVPGFGAHLCRTRPACRNVRPVEGLMTAAGLGGLQPSGLEAFVA